MNTDEDLKEVIINYEDKRVKLKLSKGSNLLFELRKNNIFIESPCGGLGNCGKCKVAVLEGIDEPTSQDLRHLSKNELDRGFRLSCGINIEKPLEISIVKPSKKVNILTAGEESVIEINSPVFKKHLLMKEPSLEDQRDDLMRITDATGEGKLIIGRELLSSITDILRKSNFDITISIYENEILSIEPGDTTEYNYGIAVDVGTTTIACYLMDLLSGNTIDVVAQINNQKTYGADVISRINYSIENSQGSKILKDSIIDQINEMVELLCKRNKINLKNIYNIAIVGNTIMIHLLLGVSTKNISRAPFIPVFTTELNIHGKEIGINIKGYVSILPNISSFIGSDITAGIISTGMVDSDKYSLLLDLGTNGEIALGNSKRVITCSTAVGPAFEGANIKCGIGGIYGAISNFNLSEEKIYNTIGGEKPIGICGSGVLDIVSEFIKHNIIDETGRIVDEEEITELHLEKRISNKRGIKEFLIEEPIEDGEGIVFTQKDIREVQMAKAAIRAGITILIENMKIDSSQIERVYIAGGFGNFMNIESSILIGMLPKEFRGKTISIGNSAGIGAKLYLLSKEIREKTRDIARKASYINLSGREDFQKYFIDSIDFEI